MVIVVENEYADHISNPGRICLHFIFQKGVNPIILPPALGK